MDRELDDLINEINRDVDSLDRDSLISLFDDMIPKIKGLQEENCDMAEKHAEKDILFNLIQANMQKRIDYLLESLEDISTEICMNRYDSGEKALLLIRKTNQKDIQFREELKKELMS